MNANGQYAIYFANKDIGKGTDFPTSYKIEENGGASLVMTDIYDSRTTQQCEGRVTRMLNKG